MEGEHERRRERDAERLERLEKTAQTARDEKQRKTYLDASFDEEANEMKEMMRESVRSSIEHLTKAEKSNIKRSASDLIQSSKPKRKKKMTFGFGEEIESSEDEELSVSDPDSTGKSPRISDEDL